MSVDIEKRRAEFENQMLELDHPLVGFIDSPWFKRAEGPNDYENEYVQGCWVGYQLFCASVVVKLPERHQLGKSTGMYTADVFEAIRAAGIKAEG